MAVLERESRAVHRPQQAVYFAIAFLSGLIPALFWVWFWLREDNKKPEPYFLIAISFISGMAVVPLALPLQELAISLYDGSERIIVWVIIEELLKYAVALGLIFWNEEPHVFELQPTHGETCGRW